MNATGRPSLLSVSKQNKSKPLLVFPQQSHPINLFLNRVLQFNIFALPFVQNTGYVPQCHPKNKISLIQFDYKAKLGCHRKHTCRVDEQG